MVRRKGGVLENEKHVRFICNICELTYMLQTYNMTNYGTT